MFSFLEQQQPRTRPSLTSHWSLFRAIGPSVCVFLWSECSSLSAQPSCFFFLSFRSSNRCRSVCQRFVCLFVFWTTPAGYSGSSSETETLYLDGSLDVCFLCSSYSSRKHRNLWSLLWFLCARSSFLASGFLSLVFVLVVLIYNCACACVFARFSLDVCCLFTLLPLIIVLIVCVCSLSFFLSFFRVTVHTKTMINARK